MNSVLGLCIPATERETTTHAPVHIESAFLAQPEGRSHAVQFYEEDEFLFDTVAQFLTAGLKAGDRVVVIASDAHCKGFCQRLKSRDAEQALDSGQLILLDAAATLSRFMVGEMPDPELFREVIGDVMRRAQDDHPHARIRAYGEMVDLLWRDGRSQAAIRTEELWNEAGRVHSFSLLCAYTIGNFYREGDTEQFLNVCQLHSHVMPTESFSRLDGSHAQLREISALRQRARSLEAEVEHRRELESALRAALQERSRVEEQLRASLEREQAARARAEANDAFKEMFLGILGHDLRNPLNTILTTARLITMREEVAPQGRHKLSRLIASGIRMQRMIEQILDVTRARLTDGIVLKRTAKQDLRLLVVKIVEEMQAAHPERSIEFHAETPCLASIDADRFEQVVSNLLGNAVSHGDTQAPVRVALGTRDSQVSLSVQNGGAIDPDFIPLLFDPFKRSRKTQGHSDGLGLGLYISERIVNAHGGRIHVDSSVQTGTRFEVVFARE